jgi:hypothetical protein
MSIVDLNITRTKVTDISILPTLPRLGRLGVQCPVKDLRPLADCKNLEALEISKVTSDISFLRALPKLQRLDDEPGANEWMRNDTPTAEQFWQKYDAQRAAQKK